jgi:bifunctional ADP-heptose synthase (sugar kinase/adenylyltransferase)
VIGGDFVKSYGGKVEFAPLLEGKSSTGIIEKMKTARQEGKRQKRSAKGHR